MADPTASASVDAGGAAAQSAVYDVAIVGYGPAGATLANQLGQAGLRVVVLDRDTEIFPLPRAIHFDGEVMRVFQGLGLRQQVAAVTRPGLKGMHFVNADGELLMVRGGTSLDGPHGCANNHYFHQPELEAVLRRGVERFANVSVLLGHDVVAIDERPDEVRLTIETASGAPPRHVAARWVVGWDGARSIVRRTMGSTMEDLGLHQPWLVFDAILKRPVALPDYTVQHCDPARPMTSCYVTGRRRRWEIMLMPGDDARHIADPASVWSLVSRWIGPDDAELERSAVYTFHSVIAQGWRRGRLMLAGDSAHQTPPFLGQGMCAGIRDCANLAWKLVAVVQGDAPASLLDSYESERRPHVHAFIDLAVRIGDVIQTTDPEAAARRDRSFREGGTTIFEFPAPGLGPGLHGDALLGGMLFPQPRLDDGRLLDEAIGARFAVLGEAQTLAAAGADARAKWEASGARVLSYSGSAAGAGIAEWLQTHGVSAAVLRPDRYLLGGARDGAELAAISARLPRLH